ncbi:MAG: hypothetical protein HGA45_21285 [Chloroflexales bacterium]|nr:hypothetical protein [Chloroflexales bacterium]
MSRTQIRPSHWHNHTWYVLNPARLILEKRIMSVRFPQFQLHRDSTKLVWFGWLITNRNNRYEIALYYPDNFPDAPPKVYPLNPAITVWENERAGRLMHQYRDGSLCLSYPADKGFDHETTAADVIAVSAAWLFSYETWKESGVWAGIEAPHEEYNR